MRDILSTRYVAVLSAGTVIASTVLCGLQFTKDNPKAISARDAVRVCLKNNLPSQCEELALDRDAKELLVIRDIAAWLLSIGAAGTSMRLASSRDRLRQ